MTDTNEPQSVLNEYNVQQALRNCHPADQRVLVDAFNRIETANQRRVRILKLLQEALSQLRLDVKYLIFDLEATRRERDLYREQLDQQQ